MSDTSWKEGIMMAKYDLEPVFSLLRKCGEVILNADRNELSVDAKGGHANFVTKYDKLVQDILKTGLLEILPDARFVGEEDDEHCYSDSGKFFIVDPIDGTTNFIKDYRMSCISVALVENGAAQFGVVYNPYSGEMFYAQLGEGAFCNGRPIRASECPLERGIVLFGTSPYNEELAERSFRLAYSLFRKSMDVRRSGSAAIDLCAIAAGRAELYFELKLSPWDYAAGGLIVTEAGGKVTTIEGLQLTFDRPCSVVAMGSSVSLSDFSGEEPANA